MKKIDVNGQSGSQLGHLLRNRRRKDLLAILEKAVALDIHFTAEEIARARKIPKREVIRLMRAGDIQAHKPTPNRWTASLSAIRKWDENTAVSLATRNAEG